MLAALLLTTWMHGCRSITENIRASFPISHVPFAQVPCVADHPTNIILLTCDAFG
jgi:phosphoenolpyruvate carboxykinase (ATP)